MDGAQNSKSVLEGTPKESEIVTTTIEKTQCSLRLCYDPTSRATWLVLWKRSVKVKFSEAMCDPVVTTNL